MKPNFIVLQRWEHVSTGTTNPKFRVVQMPQRVGIQPTTLTTTTQTVAS